MKALGMALAIAIALAPASVVATVPGVAQAAPCAGAGANSSFCQECLSWVALYSLASSRSCYEAAPPRPAQAPPSRAPETLQLPPEPALPGPALPEPAPPNVTQVFPPPSSTVPVQSPKIKPRSADTPTDASLVKPPDGLDAPPQAVAAAKAAPATRINFGALHQMLQVVDFNHQVQNVVDHRGNVRVVHVDDQALVRPRHWDYIDYDVYHRPTLYNPLPQAMTFRYFYDGAYREAYVPAGGHIVLDVATVGLFPFTAVGDSYVATGSFYGGAWIPPDGWNGPPPPDYTPPPPPEVDHDVSVDVPAGDQTVEVGQVAVVGHDDSQPAGSQDTFLLDDSTLAWGQAGDPGTSAQLRVTRTQSLPGVGPTDDGRYLIALIQEEPAQSGQPWWQLGLQYGGLAVAVILVSWLISRWTRSSDLPESS